MFEVRDYGSSRGPVLFLPRSGSVFSLFLGLACPLVLWSNGPAFPWSGETGTVVQLCKLALRHVKTIYHSGPSKPVIVSIAFACKCGGLPPPPPPQTPTAFKSCKLASRPYEASSCECCVCKCGGEYCACKWRGRGLPLRIPPRFFLKPCKRALRLHESLALPPPPPPPPPPNPAFFRTVQACC